MKFFLIFVFTFCLIFGEILACNSSVCIECNNKGGRRKRSVEPVLNTKLIDVGFKVKLFGNFK